MLCNEISHRRPSSCLSSVNTTLCDRALFLGLQRRLKHLGNSEIGAEIAYSLSRFSTEKDRIRSDMEFSDMRTGQKYEYTRWAENSTVSTFPIIKLSSCLLLE